MLPELQRRGLNFYYPTAGMTALRNFHGTTPLLFQNGATLYGTYAGDVTTLNSEEAIKGLTELTELFTQSMIFQWMFRTSLKISETAI